MIVSHRYKFIFIKTEKTAGTSIEIALSQFCGDRDIVTPISEEDESIRSELGYVGAQNTLVSFFYYDADDWANFFFRRRRAAFYNHASAAFIKAHLSQTVWNSYFKFCFERNPWDKTISYFYWKNRNKSKNCLSTFIQSGGACQCTGLGFIYHGRALGC